MDDKTFEIRRYSEADMAAWNDFVAISRQGTFLFNRGYMDYHRDRFADHSLMFYLNGKIFALLPANVDDTTHTLYSHQGLTYGGLITDSQATASLVADLFVQLNAYLRQHGIRRVVYKPMPWIYQRQPAEEDLYALTNVCHARLAVRNISSTVLTHDPVKWRRDRRYNANKSASEGVVVEQDNTALPQFWSILEDNLKTSHNTSPVHTLTEMQRLQAVFPDNIKLYVARHQNNVVAGTLVYVSPQVAHTQYISASPEGKAIHALDLMFRHVFADYNDTPCIDFGISNEDHGRYLNRGLIFQKEGFGGRGVCYDWYEYIIE